MSETHEHLEQAEHAAHGADPFTIRVAMTMAIIAAVLATITMIGHRKHNDTLRLIGDANRLRTESAAHKVEASNLFAWFQSKRLRIELAKTSVDYVDLLAPAPNTEEKRAKKVKEWESYAKKNNPPPESVVLTNGLPDEKDDTLPALQIKGNHERAEAELKAQEAKKLVVEADHVHHQADWMDLAHLAVEMGLVFCTIAVLTKRREFWISGILVAVVGIGLTGYALISPH